MRNFMRNVFTYNTPSQIIEEELKIARLNLIRAHYNLEELDCEAVKQRAEIEKLESRIHRLDSQKVLIK